MLIIIRMFLIKTLKDVMNVFYTIILPLGLLIGLGIYMDSSLYQKQILAGVLAISVIFGAFYSMGFVILQQRNRGVYRLLKSTPFSILKYVLSMALSRTIFSLTVSIIMLITGFFLFNVALGAVNILILFLILGTGTLCFTGFGFLAANFSRNEVQVSIIANLISMPMIFLSEAFYNLDSLPEWITIIGKILPFHYFVESMQTVIYNNLADFLFPFSILVIFTVSIILLASLTFRWDANMSPFSEIKLLLKRKTM